MMRSTSGLWLALWVMAGAGMGCLDDEFGGDAEAANLAIAPGFDGQTAPAGLVIPLQVNALTADGAPAVRAGVVWSVTAGNGATLSDPATLTNGAGEAQAFLTLGPDAGEYRVRASLENDPDVAVVLTAQASPFPVISTVTPTSFVSGDTVEVAGEGLDEVMVVRFGAVPGTILPSGTPQALQVVVPACLTAGPVDVRPSIQGVVGTAVTATVTSTPTMLTLTPAEWVSLPASRTNGCAMIPPASNAGAEYLVAPQLVSSIDGDSLRYRVRFGDPVAAAGYQPPRGVANWSQRFHDHLREQERRLPAVPLPPEDALAATTGTVSVGDRREFSVCDDIECRDVEDFATVDAEVVYVGRHAVIYQDRDAPQGGFDEQEFQEFGRLFDEQLYDVDTRAFGVESDVDGNGAIVILMTPVVNRLTPREQCSDSFITGFFFAIDLNPAFDRDPRSNQGEVFYSFVPDPSGTITCEHSKTRVENVVPVTFVHEFQHMISYHQHVLLRGGSTELLWLNEAMSHLAEELAALRFRDLGDDDRFSRFAIGNLFNAYDYLEDPGATYLLASAGTGTLTERGAGWLFLRWLVDQYGEELPRALSESDATGVANIERVTKTSMSALLPRWFLANWVSDLEGFQAPPALTYRSWQFRTTYASLNEQSPNTYPEPYPLQPETVFVGGSVTDVGVLRAGSGAYYRVVQLPNQDGVVISLTGPQGQALPDDAFAHVNVIRLR